MKEGNTLTSEERRAARYERRTVRRKKQKEKITEGCDDFDRVFSYGHLYSAYRKCRAGVAWKASVQRYIAQAPLNIAKTQKRLENRTYRSSGFSEFDIYERGKVRHIRSVTIDERVVQRCLCDYAMVPVLGRTFIYDNGASLKDRGYHFSIRRLCRHLRRHYRKHGTEGYILLFDFSKFFDRVSHALIERIMYKEFADPKIIGLTMHFVKMFGDIGIGLGSQISQTFALASANRLDHYAKEVLRIRGYGRYMDDGYLIHRSKEYLRKCLDGIRKICGELEITLNEGKTHIVKLSHGFTYLKTRFFLLPGGKVLRRICKASIVRERRKLKRFAKLLRAGEMRREDIAASFRSWRAYAANFRSWHTARNMETLYGSLFAETI